MSDDIDDENVRPDLADQIILVHELASLNDALNDPDVEWTLNKVIKLIAKPDIPAKVAMILIVKLQGMAFKFKVQGKFYMFRGKSQPNAAEKKNYYMTLADETEKLVQALKYVTKAY